MHDVYTFDTSAFYTEKERSLDLKLQRLRKLSEKVHAIEYTNEIIKKTHIHRVNSAINKIKGELKDLIQANINKPRSVCEKYLCEKNIVSIFDSNLTRTLKMSPEELNLHLVIIKVYFFGIAESIIKNGFYMNNQKYVFFSASAGQIRTKKFVAVREDDLRRVWNTLTCGLSIEHTNELGGVNINKYLAYLALCNSATDVWADFDIDRCIVVDDFETCVDDVVDYIDDTTYEITRTKMPVPIPHTDGCGMILPKLSKKNFMVRMPWVKGLLTPFPFDKFAKEYNSTKVCDIYGKEYDIIKDKIQIIFTKSQFKMWKYFDSWNEYCENFKRYGCSAGICNMEDDYVPNAKFNYQMLQTLHDLTDEELSEICSETNSKIKALASDRNTMLRVFGATKQNTQMNSFQKCLSLYPELLQDAYTKETLRDLKKSIEKEARAGKIDVKGKYLFLIPDMYAFCEWLFLGIEVPEGLLKNKEVYAKAFPDATKLDCLRSPHLYMEHCVRWNVCGIQPDLKKWFKTNGIYTSTHDNISKILMFDRP